MYFTELNGSHYCGHNSLKKLVRECLPLHRVVMSNTQGKGPDQVIDL